MARDKFAAMASRAAAAASTNAESSDTAPSAAGGSESESRDEPSKGVERAAGATVAAAATAAAAATTETAPAPAAPRRDKLAAMAARGHSPVPPNLPKRGGNKLAAMVAREANKSPIPPSRDNDKNAKQHEAKEAAAAEEEQQQRRADHLAKLQARLKQRKEILQRLDRAEDLTLELLQIAGQTADALQDLNLVAANVTSSSSSSSPSSSSARPRLDLAQLSAAYRATLKEIHPLLSQDGTEDLIRPYQNHSREEDPPPQQQQQQQSVYTARVEMRLAQERASVLRAFTELEQRGQRLLVDDSNDADDTRVAPGDKRKRESSGGGSSSGE